LINLLLCFFIILSITFILLYLKQKNKNEITLATTIELLLLNEEQKSSNKTNEEAHAEDFLRFVSQSRDWAYEYIETAQAGIQEFVDSVGSDIDYMDKYRPPVISEESTNRLINSYQRLKTLLPETDK